MFQNTQTNKKIYSKIVFDACIDFLISCHFWQLTYEMSFCSGNTSNTLKRWTKQLRAPCTAAVILDVSCIFHTRTLKSAALRWQSNKLWQICAGNHSRLSQWAKQIQSGGITRRNKWLSAKHELQEIYMPLNHNCIIMSRWYAKRRYTLRAMQWPNSSSNNKNNMQPKAAAQSKQVIAAITGVKLTRNNKQNYICR